MFSAQKKLLHHTQQVFLADPQLLAGETGEGLTAECIRRTLKARTGEARLYPSLRVPRKDGLGKSEIDFVLLTPQGLWVLEVKHWSGRIRRQGTQWIHASIPCQKAVEDPWITTQKKTTDLIHWLQRRGCSIAPSAVKTLVVLSHSDVELHDELQNDSSLIRLSDLSQYLKTQILHAAERPLPYDFDALKAQLKQLPTWDLIQFYGGRIWRGDLHTLILETPSHPLQFSRQNFASAEISCPRTFWQSLLGSPRAVLTDWRGSRSSYRLREGSHLIFQAAGQPLREQISLLHVEHVNLGSRDQAYYQSFGATAPHKNQKT